jgi:hypothetical protein
MPERDVAPSAVSELVPVSEPILFMHLPKTAGTALRNLFARHLGEERVSKNLNMRLEEALVRYADLNAVCGHFHVEQGQRLPADRISMTVLRDPVDRFLSHYYFRKFDAQNQAIDQRVRSRDLDQFIEEQTSTDIDDLNLQTSLLYPLGTESWTMLSWSERVIAAQRALDRFDCVGIHNEIDDFVCMICARMGWSPDAALDRVNVTSRRTTPDQLPIAARRKLDELLQYDQLVFEYAVERFRQSRRASITASAVHRIASPRGADALPSPRSCVPEPREFGDRRLELVNVRVMGELSGESLAMIGERLNIHIQFVAHEPVDSVTAGFLIRDERGLPVFGTDTYLLGDIYQVTPGMYSFRFSLLNRVECGAYTVDVKLIRNSSHLEGCYHWKDNAARFDVHGWAAVSFVGRVMMDACADLTRMSAAGSIETMPVQVDRSRPASTAGRLNPPLSDFSARLTLLSELSSAQTGTELLVDIEIENSGIETWHTSGKRPVCLSYHWHDQDGNVIEYDGVRTFLPRDLQPGERIRLVGLLRAPHCTGLMRLTWTLVQEDVGWFDENDGQSRYGVDVRVVT